MKRRFFPSLEILVASLLVALVILASAAAAALWRFP